MIRLISFIVLLTLLTGCIADNKTRQGPITIEHKPQISVPAPEITTENVDTDKLVEDVASRVNADMSSNSNQLSGHLVAQLQKLEANLKGLVNLEAKMDNKMQADLRADLTNTMTALTRLEATFTANVNVTNEMKATLTNQMKALSDIQASLGNVAGQADATASAQVGLKNDLTKVQATLQSDIKASAGRDVNMWPMSAVLTVIAIMLVMGGLMYGITVFIGKRAYDNARPRQEDYINLLTQAMGELEPHKAKDLLKTR